MNRCALLLLGTLCAMLAPATVRAETPTVQGRIVRKVADVDRVVPCHGVDMAFAWKRGEKGLFFVDPDGTVINRETPLLPEAYIVNVVAERAGAGGWILSKASSTAESRSLSFVSSCAKDVSATLVTGFTPSAHWDRMGWPQMIWPSDARGPTAWVVQLRSDGKSGAKLDWLVLDGAVARQFDSSALEYREDSITVGKGLLWRLKYYDAKDRKRVVQARLEVHDFAGKRTLDQPDRDGCLVPPGDGRAIAHTNVGISNVGISPVSADVAWTVLNQDHYAKIDNLTNLTHVICLLEPGKGFHRVFAFDDKRKSFYDIDLKYAIDENHLWLYGMKDDFSDSAAKLYLIDANPDAKASPLAIPARGILGGDGHGGLWILDEGTSFLVTMNGNKIERRSITLLSGAMPMPISQFEITEEWQTRFSSSGYSWVDTFDAAHYRNASGEWSSALLSDYRISGLLPFSSRNGAWVETDVLRPASGKDSGIFTIRVLAQVSAAPVDVHIAAAALDSTKGATPQIICAEPLSASVDLKWPGAAGAREDEVIGRFELRLERESQKPITATRTLRDGNELVFKDAHCEPGRYQVVLRYTDQLGSELEIRWPEVNVISSFWNRRSVQTGLAFFALLITTCIFALIRPHRFRAAGWLPPLGTFLAGGGEYAFLAKANIDFGWVAGLTAGGALFLMVAGAVSPRMFRQLVGIAPYDRVLPVAMTFGLFRRRLLQDYVARLREVLREQREGASDESYFELPARIEDHPEIPADQAALADVPRQLPIADAPPRPPVVEIAKVLADPDVEHRMHVFIEAPAGRGKSALIRAVVDKLLKDFVDRPSAPLPVLCSKPGTEIEKLVEDEMLRDALSLSVVKAQLGRGLFVLVVDAVDEATWQPDQLRRLIRGSYPDTRALVASRPSAARSEVFAHADRWKRVEPAALDDGTIGGFERHYHAADQKKGLASHLLTNDLRRICRNGHDGYSPLLVRFAMRSPGERVASVYVLYGSVLGRLLRSAAPDTAEPLLTRAAELCEATLWRTGQREFTLEEIDAKYRDVVTELKAASVVVPVAGAAFRLRFFHSTVQSFLVARALAPTADGAVLATAAGDPRFLQERSDLLGTGGSDVFHFLVHARSPEVVRQHLRAKLSAWCAAVGNDLGRSLILGACPAVVDDDFQRWLGAADRSNATVLTEILRRLEPRTTVGDVVRTAKGAADLHADTALLVALFAASASSALAPDTAFAALVSLFAASAPDAAFAALVELFAALAPSALALERSAAARGRAA